ncbi:LysR family transcriptional regulator [Alphaproteobacteria bacterium GH1-50]|uniref:LysR family transcriptional regulator n=1 Tax=Kangsaoukella pontilimi TaxID=2691042 RepID=A0A7C9IQX2_9RHOB|nr:LysR family transcriptional regulator [Kangsaoukella pontilimi]MXQ09790.1 LysR family transcriptional regulator [Kangsaoukella pontilimi]
MQKALNALDWTHLKTFLAVAEAGSLTGAARRLGQSQPTVGRHIKAMETALGVELFVRDLTGFTLTETGATLLEPAHEMALAAARLAQLAAGQDISPSGTVRITASVVVSNYVLPPVIARLRKAEPNIEIELYPSDATENLVFREADIAIRMYRPTQLDTVVKHLADQQIALYAATSLLDEFGQPESLDALSEMPFVGFDKSDMIIQAMRGMGLQVDRGFFGVRCDDQATYWQLVCAGCGVGAMQRRIGDRTPGVSRLIFQPDLPPLPMWLAAPEALRRNARIRRIWDLLVAELGRLGE